MRATNWEFANRALIFGMIFGISFPLYAVDHRNATAVLASWIGPMLGINGDLVVRGILALAALLLVISAFIRTWASAYLHARVVYGAVVKTETLVAEGPYRRVRNPLYFANVLMAIGLGFVMSRTGFAIAVTAMVIFCYRLILREEAEFDSTQGEAYKRYRRAVPRLCPALWPRIASSGRPAQWVEGLKAECWYWGVAVALAVFALTLSISLFFVILAGSIGFFWVSSTILRKK